MAHCKLPKKLKTGDHVRIISTARIIDKEVVDDAIKLLTSWGLTVSLGKSLFEKDNQFAGSRAQRIFDLQDALNDASVDMIWLARGGYGTVSLLDDVDFNLFRSLPKWVVGYSDITGLLCHIHNMGIACLHGPMPVNLASTNSDDVQIGMNHLKSWLFGQDLTYDMPNHALSQPGNCNGEMIGGNLSILYSILGSSSVPDFSGKILFLEDLDEYLYHIDRMMLNLSRNGLLENLAGLVVGGMTDMNDNQIPFGKSAEEIISGYVKKMPYPVYFGFPAGHGSLNLPLPFGVQCSINQNELAFYH